MSDANKIDDGGAVFPMTQGFVQIENGAKFVNTAGLTKRDYFAAAALTGLLAYPDSHLNCGTAPDAARTAFELADALLAASKTGGPEHD